MLSQAGVLVLSVTIVESAASAKVPCDGGADALGTARVLSIDTTARELAASLSRGGCRSRLKRLF